MGGLFVLVVVAVFLGVRDEKFELDDDAVWDIDSMGDFVNLMDAVGDTDTVDVLLLDWDFVLVADIVADLVVSELQVVVFDRGGVREYVGVPVLVFVVAAVLEGLTVAVDVLEDVLVLVVVRVMRGVGVDLAEFENEGEEELVFDGPVYSSVVKFLVISVIDNWLSKHWCVTST